MWVEVGRLQQKQQSLKMWGMPGNGSITTQCKCSIVQNEEANRSPQFTHKTCSTPQGGCNTFDRNHPKMVQWFQRSWSQRMRRVEHAWQTEQKARMRHPIPVLSTQATGSTKHLHSTAGADLSADVPDTTHARTCLHATFFASNWCDETKNRGYTALCAGH
jgi:hypothetical protein